MNFKTNLVVVLLLTVGCRNDDPAPSEALYFPPVGVGGWETSSRASIGWDESKMVELKEFLQSSNTRAFLVLVNGKIVIEEYFGKQLDNTTNFSASSYWYWASAGKTLTSALVGIAEGQSKINLDAKTSDYLGVEWTSLTTEQEGAITVRNQLTMTTGLDDGVPNTDCTLPSCLLFKAAPGSRWAYHNAPYTLLDDVITNSTGKSLNDFLSDEISPETGITGSYIRTGDNNVFYSNARSMARFGLLLLNKGKWSDTQIIQLMITPSQSLTWRMATSPG